MSLPGITTLDANGPFAEPSTFTDPLANATACQRDLPYLTQLGINAVHVYSVDAALNHDSCMQALSGAGIYVMYVTMLEPRVTSLTPLTTLTYPTAWTWHSPGMVLSTGVPLHGRQAYSSLTLGQSTHLPSMITC
jgi:hypothetical protein